VKRIIDWQDYFGCRVRDRIWDCIRDRARCIRAKVRKFEIPFGMTYVIAFLVTSISALVLSHLGHSSPRPGTPPTTWDTRGPHAASFKRPASRLAPVCS
jgi:hypothetical protein